MSADDTPAPAPDAATATPTMAAVSAQFTTRGITAQKNRFDSS